MLEALQHDCNSFGTFTYSDEHVPTGVEGVPTLDPRHPRDFLKRLRKALEPETIRYYLVGEYGDASGRPHYHAALFGYPGCEYGRTRQKERCCNACDTLRATWGLGHIVNGELNVQSAAYIAGYVTKKLDKSNPRLGERFPEFARMSLRPGIGGDAMWDVASTLLAFGLDEKGDVPSHLRHGAKLLPLGRYLRRRLRTYVGKAADSPQETIDQGKEALRPMWEDAQNAPTGFRGATFKSLVLTAHDVRVGQMETKRRIYKDHETL